MRRAGAHEVHRRVLAGPRGFHGEPARPGVRRPGGRGRAADPGADQPDPDPRRHAQSRRPRRSRSALRWPTCCGCGSSTTPDRLDGVRRSSCPVPARRPSTSTPTQPAPSITSGGLTARITRDQFQIDFEQDGRTLTSVLPRSIGLAVGPDRATLRLPAADPGCRRTRLRPWRAVRSVRQERPVDRHLERRRRHEQRAGLQERALLLDQQRLRGLRQPPRAGVVRGRLGSGVRATSSRSPGEHLEYFVIAGPSPEADPRPVHRAHRPGAAGPALVVRAVAVHVVHHRLRRGDRQPVPRRDGGARDPAQRLPFRLLLDARVPLVRLRVGPAARSRTRRRCWPG